MNARPNPVLLVPWDEDFMSAVAGILFEISGDDPSRATIVFPHQRPKRYLTDLLARDRRFKKPLLMPKVFSLHEFISAISAKTQAEGPLRQAGLLDQVGLLHECVEELADSGKLGSSVPNPGRDDLFFPWGVRLAGLLEELLLYGFEPRDLALYEDELLEDFVRDILSGLGAIFRLYDRKMREKGLTTHGFEAFRLFRNPPPAESFAGNMLILAGFNALAKAEEELFRHLWMEADAAVVLFGDPALAEGGKEAHWSCLEQRKMLERWKAPVQLKSFGRKVRPARITYYEGFDLHSQLKALVQDFKDRFGFAGKSDDSFRVGVVLPDTAMLMPALHHLPIKEVNISMGYPFKISALAQLISILLKLQETRLESGDGKYYWRDVIALLRHPYLKMLGRGQGRPLRNIFHLLEETIRRGGKFLDPRLWRDEPGLYRAVQAGLQSEDVLDFMEETASLLDRAFELCLSAFESVGTLAELAESVDVLLQFLDEGGGDLWEHFPIDAQCFYRLRKDVLPSLKDNALSLRKYPRPVLFEIFLQAIAAERTPFEADSLAALQILGFLESRLLSFDVVYILGATDERLPGISAPDSLMPEAVRSLIGLSDSRKREQVAAYNFFSLLHSAGEAVILYETGSASGGLDRAAQRSRFVEELLWEEEKKQGRILKAGQPPVFTISYSHSSARRSLPGIEKTPAVRELMKRRLAEKALSVSALDSFIRCPAKFFYERLIGFTPLAEISEEEDAGEIGKAVHSALFKFMRSRIGHGVSADAADREELQAAFSGALKSCPEWEYLPLGNRMLVEEAGRARLGHYLAAMPETVILGVEVALETEFAFNGAVFRLKGRLDRVDRRENGLIILDYKTGAVPKIIKSFWKDDALWEAILDRDLDGAKSDALMAEISGRLASIQLPGYLWLYHRSTGMMPWDAAFIDLRGAGKEEFLLGGRIKEELRREALEARIPGLMEFIFGYMLNSPVFYANPGDYCRYCGYANLCGI